MPTYDEDYAKYKESEIRGLIGMRLGEFHGLLIGGMDPWEATETATTGIMQDVNRATEGRFYGAFQPPNVKAATPQTQDAPAINGLWVNGEYAGQVKSFDFSTNPNGAPVLGVQLTPTDFRE